STVFGVDHTNMKLEVKRAEQKWALPKHLGLKKLAKELDLHAKQPGTVNKQNLPLFLDKLTEFYGEQTALTQTAAHMGLNDETAIEGYCRLIAAEHETGTEFNKLTDEELPQFMDIHEADRSEDIFAFITEETAKMKSGIGRLRERTALQIVIEQMKAHGMDSTVAAMFSGDVTFAELPTAFDNAFSRAVIDSAFRRDSELGTFSDTKFDSEIQRYRDTAAEFERLTIQELCAKLSANVPNVTSGAGNSEVAVLQKAIRSGGRMMSIRKLFDRIPNLLRRLCPCMLMSPISCAQYIDPSFPKFDLVVFDEASQLPTSEAVGAIARGENVIVVGDPRQLPPTSFFSVNRTDEDQIENEDLESVLDDCLALTMPSKHLLWHYRSRHESLIAFSNARFYENKLLTFPSPDDPESKVTWVNVPGVYDRSKTKVNRAEAEAVVAEISRRLRDDTLCRDSIGVVTFSIVQQNLIDDLLSDAFIADPQLEARANDMYEPIIIKNLENVQGDERDVILFSIGYGPDKDGKVSMNFGPINRDGGWRRL
ncbi:MAG: DNA2/NAM7 family helicase, partial [Ruminococcus sp.]|nr:DNA2/NAM7 family helicase [Ruminococcus sp.]